MIKEGFTYRWWDFSFCIDYNTMEPGCPFYSNGPRPKVKIIKLLTNPEVNVIYAMDCYNGEYKPFPLDVLVECIETKERYFTNKDFIDSIA